MALLHLPRVIHVNSAGSPYALAKLYVYEDGTTTEIALWTTKDLNVSLTNPVVADSNGLFPAIYINSAAYQSVRVQLKTSADVLIYDEDEVKIVESDFGAIQVNSLSTGGDISAQDYTGETLTLSKSEPRIVLNETDVGTDLKRWDIHLNSQILSIRTRTDADGAGKKALEIVRGATTAISSILIGNGTDTPTIFINGTQVVAASIVQESSSSFTGTLTGMAAGTTGSISYRKHGNLVTLYAGAGLLGTSNTTALTMTGLPAALQPASARICYCALIDNGAEIGGAAYLLASGTITFQTAFAGTGAFTAANSKGLASGWQITYSL